MCAASNGAMLPYNLNVKIPHPTPYIQMPQTGMSQAALDLQRMQLLDYSARLRYGLAGLPHTAHPFASLYHPHAVADPLAQAYFLHKHDPRARFVHEEPKPSHSYIGLIAMAILASKEKKLVLSDIYQWILDNYAYFRTRGPGWRNSIRHNLSLNDCFIKAGRSANGKGHYWAVHPANVDDFTKGDFRRRRAQRKVRKHMGLAVPDDDEDDDSPPPSNVSAPIWQSAAPEAPLKSPSDLSDKEIDVSIESLHDESDNGPADKTEARIVSLPSNVNVPNAVIGMKNQRTPGSSNPSKRRLFDVESLLAPDPKVARVSHEIPTGNQHSPSKIEHLQNIEPASPEDLSLNGDKDNSTEKTSQQTPSPKPKEGEVPLGLPGFNGSSLRAPLGAPFAYTGAFQPNLLGAWRTVASSGFPLQAPVVTIPSSDAAHNKNIMSQSNILSKSPAVSPQQN